MQCRAEPALVRDRETFHPASAGSRDHSVTAKLTANFVHTDTRPRNPGGPGFVKFDRKWTTADVDGRQKRGLQNRLRGVRKRSSKFGYGRRCPCPNRMTASDSQDSGLRASPDLRGLTEQPFPHAVF